jgi:hypothetical protein
VGPISRPPSISAATGSCSQALPPQQPDFKAESLAICNKQSSNLSNGDQVIANGEALDKAEAQQAAAVEQIKKKEVPVDWLDEQFLFMLETYLLALPMRKVESASMTNIKHLFT